MSDTTLAPPRKSSAVDRRLLITFSVMLATIMQALDTTIANVALPHMQGAMGATQDQTSWVLTSYIVAAAIAMPLTGFISARIGRKRLFVISVIGFTVASMLCGAAQSLNQIVLFRLLQGIFGASLVPLSQSVMLDSWPPEKQGSAMAMWGMGVMVGPILGPALGGWLTEYYSWRWVFYINIPFGVLAWLGISTFVTETPIDSTRRFDLLGFFFLSVAIGSLQLFLDRGESKAWFASGEIITEAVLAALTLYLFVVHIFTIKKPFIDPAIFRDKNFVVGLLFSFVVGTILLATMALMPPLLQGLMGYPVIDVGLLMTPRGFGTMFSMMLVGRMAGKVDMRHVITVGIVIMAASLWMMTRYAMWMSPWDIVSSGVVQGVGMGLTFVPLSTLTFSTLQPQYRTEGTALYSLIRNIGSSIGISVVTTYLAQQSQRNHMLFSGFINPFNKALQHDMQAGAYNIHHLPGLVAINGEVTRQAMVLAYYQDFRLMMFLCFILVPLVLLFSKPVKYPAK
ncbi:DHA2 family efflux MFS transporter permease subunit [Raoultella terrigena]|uniref:DHA2 family efflux MFS transporter permease subunit n=1 Tax=Raoultella terrigena TaxID=577 RepID=UPI00349FD0B0